MKMQMQRKNLLAGLAAATVAAAAMVQADNLKDVEITDEFPLDRCIESASLVTSCVGGDCNAYLPLIEGRVWVLDNANCDDCDEDEQVTISILGTQMVAGHATRVMEEREMVDGELAEVSRNFLSQCSNTQDVYYWGEEVCVAEDSDGAIEEPPFEYETPCEEGLTFGAGAWKAGVGEEGAEDEPGILFPGGAFQLGARYFQERSVVARDWAEHAERGLTADDPANGEFENCVKVLDRNLIEDPKSKEAGDEKVYCPGIGIVQDEELELTSCTTFAVNCEQ